MCTAVRSECSQDFRRSLCQTSCNRSPITFGTPAHMACVQVIPGAVIWRVSTEHLISDAKTLLQVLFWRAQHHSLGRKSRIDIFQSHMRQIAAPTVPVRTGEHEERESVGSVESRFPPPCRAMRWRRKAPKTAKIEPHPAVSGKVTHTPSSAPCPPPGTAARKACALATSKIRAQTSAWRRNNAPQRPLSSRAPGVWMCRTGMRASSRRPHGRQLARMRAGGRPARHIWPAPGRPRRQRPLRCIVAAPGARLCPNFRGRQCSQVAQGSVFVLTWITRSRFFESSTR
jgi:hypothetical protein